MQSLIANKNYIKPFYEDEMEKTKKRFLPAHATGQDYRAFKTFATCGIGGLLATKYGITAWEGIDVMEAIMINFMAWLEAKGGVGSQEEKQALTQIRLFFEKYGASRFQSLLSDGDLSTERPPNERAGFITYRIGEPLFYVFKNYFEEIIARGLDFKHVKTILRNKGILETDTDRGRFDKNVWLNGKTKRMYVINNKIFEGENND